MFISYRGYSGKVYPRKYAGLICGEVEGISDLVAFQSSEYSKLHEIFEDTVDDYISACEEYGHRPLRRLVLA